MTHPTVRKLCVIAILAMCSVGLLLGRSAGADSLRSGAGQYGNQGAAGELRHSETPSRPTSASGSKAADESPARGAVPKERGSTRSADTLTRRNVGDEVASRSRRTARCVGITAPYREDPGATSAVLVAAPGLLDALAREYCSTVKDPSVEEFALYWAYNRLMSIVLGGSKPPVGVVLDPANDRDLRRVLWVAHVLGICQANWLWSNDHDGETYGPPAERSPTGPLNILGVFDPGYRTSSSRLEQQLQLANRGSAGDVLAFNLNSVRGDELLPGTRGLGIYALPPMISGLGDYFYYTYCLGFMKAVVGLNRPNVRVPDWARIDYTLGAELDATYRAGDAPFLKLVRGKFKAAADGENGLAAQERIRLAVEGKQPLDSLATQALVPFAAGTAVWNSIANVRSYSERQYHLVLRDGIDMTQWVHANALAGLVAHATRDVGLGRQQVRAHALYASWEAAYLKSLPAGDPSFPQFRTR